MELKDNFVSYQIARELKELGFDEPCFRCYWLDNGNSEMANYPRQGFLGGSFDSISSPLFQQVEDFLREKYNVSIEFCFFPNSITFCIKNIKTGEVLFNDNIDTYESARTAAIEKAIEIIKENKL